MKAQLKPSLSTSFDQSSLEITRDSIGLRVAAVITLGFFAAVGMWVMWFITHIPAINASSAASAVLCFATLAVGLILGRTKLRWESPRFLGVFGGLTAGLVTLVLFGSHLSEQATSLDEMTTMANQFRAGAPLAALGFLLLCAALGLIADAFATMIRCPDHRDITTRSQVVRYIFACTLALAFIPVLLVGGLVTGSESGMAVPDSVTSYGAISFLFPAELMGEPRIFLEHSHRLLASLLGLTTIAGVAVAFGATRQKAAHIIAIALFVLVVIQGLAGALRVGENLSWMAAIHGVFAQIVFSCAVAAAVFAAPPDHERPNAETVGAASSSRKILIASIVVLLFQLLFGSLSRHLGSYHALAAHVGNAVIAFLIVSIAAAVLMRADPIEIVGRRLRWIGKGIVTILSIQIMLGVVSIALIATGEPHPDIPLADELAVAQPFRPLELAITTGHQTTGAVLLAFVAMGWAWSTRVTRHVARETQAEVA